MYRHKCVNHVFIANCSIKRFKFYAFHMCTVKPERSVRRTQHPTSELNHRAPGDSLKSRQNGTFPESEILAQEWKETWRQSSTPSKWDLHQNNPSAKEVLPYARWSCIYSCITTKKVLKQFKSSGPSLTVSLRGRNFLKVGFIIFSYSSGKKKNPIYTKFWIYRLKIQKTITKMGGTSNQNGAIPT